MRVENEKYEILDGMTFNLLLNYIKYEGLFLFHYNLLLILINL